MSQRQALKEGLLMELQIELEEIREAMSNSEALKNLLEKCR
jgi:hypothetical protein